jgi:hypothetical protein
MKGGDKMKKLLVFLVMAGVLMGFVFAVETSTFLTARGDASSTLSNLHETSGENSARISAEKIIGATNEGRVLIEFGDSLLLEDLETLSWMQHVEEGYASHVDIFLDNSEVLVFEYAKVDPLDCDDSSDYPSGDINTFGDKGIVDDNAFAWKNGPVPGPCGSQAFDDVHKSLADWKTEYPGVKVSTIEIEVDGWIPTNDRSTSFIDDVTVNGEVIEDFEGVQGGAGQIVPDTTFIPNPNPLNFGDMIPGQSSVATSTLSVGTSNLDVIGIAVAPVTGSVFTEDNVLFSSDGGSTFVGASSVPVISIPAQNSFDLPVKLSVPVGTSSESFSGVITYTVVETP